MNLRKVGTYDIGLDIGTNSVGWAVTDETGALCHFKGKPTWGSRLFSEASTAADARIHRGQRRRYERRRWRLNLLQEFFAQDMAQLDPEFFNRLNSSYLVKEDRSWHNPLFNTTDFAEADYYQKFPTIYHLRAHLLESSEKEDLRLVYLALHNIVKCRGNFLREGESISAKNANMDGAVDNFVNALQDWCDLNGISCDCRNCAGEIAEVLQDKTKKNAWKRDDLMGLFLLGNDCETSSKYKKKDFEKALASAILGYKTEFSKVFFEEIEGSSFKLKEEDKVDSFMANCPDEGKPLFDALCALYSSFVLAGILKGGDGKTISYVKINEYAQYKSDLALLKRMTYEYAPEKYSNFFRGARYAGTQKYDPSKASGYTKYDLGTKKLDYDGLKSEVKKLFAGTAAEATEDYQFMMERFEEETFLRRQKTSDNGCIPYQLHFEEYVQILESQGKFYPFLLEHKKELSSLVTFRIPYYVGPLGTTMRDARFAWSTRKEGMEDVAIKPWNWDEVIDRNKSAEDFIQRMTASCTYLLGEPVLPKSSLLYEEFCVLNELNGSFYTQDGDRKHRFDAADREAMVKELFCKRRVSQKVAEDWLSKRGHSNVHVGGFQGETGYESRLGSYIFFCKDVFEVEELPLEDYPMIEEIILWNTLFEDRSILEEKLRLKYGTEGLNRLNDNQIKAICKKRFTGWGKLSRKFLSGMKVETNQGMKSIIEIMREGNPNNSRGARAMVLMEVLHEDEFGFDKKIEEQNAEYMHVGFKIEDLPGSPAVRRSLNQAKRIVEEIVKIAGKEPRYIFVEEASGEDAKARGQRTKSRHESLMAALATFKEEYGQCDPDIVNELKDLKPDMLNERLMLYFMQGGKCLYSGRPIEIGELGAGKYEVDHILPQSYIKDDSFENKALVYRSENQRKTDSLLLSDTIRMRQKSYWRALRDAGLIGPKKYKNLMRDRVTDEEMKGFINRQLVETRQTVKFARQILSDMYPDTEVKGIKAGISSQLRDREGFIKCRDINDYHHAHDAYLACAVGRFIAYRYADVFNDPIRFAGIVKAEIRKQAKEATVSESIKVGGGKPYARPLPGDSAFIVNGFCRTWVDEDTGEAWVAEDEIAQIRKSLNFKDCFISRMPEITSGSFWKATVASPHTKGNQNLPLKDNRPSEKYGSYTETHFAHFFVYEMKNKKGKNELVFGSVPVSMAEADSKKQNALLERLATSESEAKGGEFVRVVRPVIYKGQLIEVGGERFRIRGTKAMVNATEMAFTQGQTLLLKVLFGLTDPSYAPSTFYERAVWNALQDDGELSLESFARGTAVPGDCRDDIIGAICEMFDVESFDAFAEYGELLQSIESKFDSCARRQGDLLSVKTVLASLAEKETNVGSSVLKQIIPMANGQVDRANLSIVGGSKVARCPQPTYAKLLNSSDLVFIDQSVTGMYERRYKLGL